MVSAREEAEVELLVQRVLDRLGESDCVVDIEWNKRFTSRVGDARYYPETITVPERATVRLSSALWPRMNKDERDSTVIHEACHIVAKRKAARGGRYIRPHGPEWKALMRACGEEPEVYHKIDNSDLKRTYKTKRTSCLCRVHFVTKKVYSRMLLGTRKYICKICKCPIMPIIEEEDNGDELSKRRGDEATRARADTEV